MLLLPWLAMASRNGGKFGSPFCYFEYFSQEQQQLQKLVASYRIEETAAKRAATTLHHGDDDHNGGDLHDGHGDERVTVPGAP